MITYDPKVIQECADSLYSRAESAVIGLTIVGFLVGFVVAFLSHELLYSLGAAFIGGFAGYLFGKDKATQFRLQAQQALCLVEIESNSQK
jgi:hypothetical protein